MADDALRRCFTPEMRCMVDCAVRAPTEIRDPLPLPASIDINVTKLSAMSVAVRSIEADELLDRGFRVLFAGDTSAGHKLTVEKVYDPVVVLPLIAGPEMRRNKGLSLPRIPEFLVNSGICMPALPLK